MVATNSGATRPRSPSRSSGEGVTTGHLAPTTGRATIQGAIATRRPAPTTSAARPHLPAQGQDGRRAASAPATPRPRVDLAPARRPLPRRRDLRDHERRRHDGPRARPRARSRASTACKMISIADLIEYRRQHEKLVRASGRGARSPPTYGDFRAFAYESIVDGQHARRARPGRHRRRARTSLVRVHSECLTGRRLRLAAVRLRRSSSTRAIALIGREGPRRRALRPRPRGPRRSACCTSSGPTSSRSRAATPSRRTSSSGFPADQRDYGIGAQILDGPRRPHDAPAHEQPGQAGGPRGLRARDHRAGAAADRADRREHRVPAREAEKMGHLLDVPAAREPEARSRGRPRRRPASGVAIVAARFNEVITSRSSRARIAGWPPTGWPRTTSTGLGTGCVRDPARGPAAGRERPVRRRGLPRRGGPRRHRALRSRRERGGAWDRRGGPRHRGAGDLRGARHRYPGAGRPGRRGWEAAEAALEMAWLLDRLPGKEERR